MKQIIQDKITKLLNSTIVDVEARDVKKELGLDEPEVAVDDALENDELGQYIASRSKNSDEDGENVVS